jgi:predicted flap endonuclease-1-like 5' DNA nuclease
MIGKLRLLILGIFAALVFQRWMSQRQGEAAVTKEKPLPPAPQPVSRRAPDPLTEINGIGPAFEKALNAIGISSFAELAKQNADELAQRLPVRVTADRIRRDGWIEQARLKAKGD